MNLYIQGKHLESKSSSKIKTQLARIWLNQKFNHYIRFFHEKAMHFRVRSLGWLLAIAWRL